MDSWVAEILQEWNLTDYKNQFIEQKITQEAFLCLDDETIKDLFDKAGPRAIFKKRWSDFIQHYENSEKFENLTLANDSSHNTVVDQVPSAGDVLIEEVEADILDPFETIDNTDISLELCNPISDLTQSLRQSITGVCVLTYFQKNHMLTDYYRNLLCDTILHVEIRSNTDLQLSSERFINLSKLIVEVFCTENIQTYYVPYYYDKIAKKKILAKGKLYQRYNHLRSILLESGVAINSRGVKRKHIEKSLVHLGFYDELSCPEVTDEINQQLDFLQDNIDPWNSIELYWKNTSVIRIKGLIENKSTSSVQYINSFPILQNIQKAPILINIDFNTQHSSKSNLLKTEIDSFKDEIYRFCKSKKKLDKEIAVLLSKLETAKAKKDQQDFEDLIVFRLLPLLLPCPPPIYTPKNDPYRPKKSDVQEEFLHHSKSDKELEVYLKKRQANCKSYGISEQPLSVIVGETLESIHTYYLIINNTKYKAQSTRELVDLNFKSCYSFQLAFSKIAIYPFLVLQERIFKIKGETDEVRPIISTFITNLKSTR